MEPKDSIEMEKNENLPKKLKNQSKIKMAIKKEISKTLGSRKSEEYQKLLAAIRVYASILWQNKIYSNILLVTFIMIFFAATLPFVSIYYLHHEINMTYYLYSTIFNLIPLFFMLIFIMWAEHQFKFLKSLKIIIFNKFNFYFTLFMMIVMIVLLISKPLSFSDSLYLLITTFLYSYLFLVILGIADFLETKSIINFSIQQLKESENKNEKRILSRYQLFYYSINLYYNRVYKNINEKFKENTLQIIGLRYLLLLASEIFYNDVEYRKKILDILNRLQKTDPIINNKEFLSIIKDIRTGFNTRYIEVFGKEPDDKIYYYPSRWKKIKSLLLFLFPLISIILTIIKFLIHE